MHNKAPTQNGMTNQQIVDFMWKCIVDASSSLQKGLTFYLAIFAGTTGYLLSANLRSDTKQVIFFTVLSISLFTAIAAGYLAYGIWAGVRDMGSVATARIDGTSQEILLTFINRGRNAVVIAGICVFFILCSFVFALVGATQ